MGRERVVDALLGCSFRIVVEIDRCMVMRVSRGKMCFLFWFCGCGGRVLEIRINSKVIIIEVYFVLGFGFIVSGGFS